MTYICVSDLTSIGSDNGLSPGRRQAIIRTNAGILLIRPLGTNFSEFLVEILIFLFTKMCLKVSSAKRRPFCLGLNQLTLEICRYTHLALNTLKPSDAFVHQETMPSLVHMAKLLFESVLVYRTLIETNFNEIWIKFHQFPIIKMHIEMVSAKWRPFCLGLSVLTHWDRDKMAAISQMAFLNAFSSMKNFDIRINFLWIFSLIM